MKRGYKEAKSAVDCMTNDLHMFPERKILWDCSQGFQRKKIKKKVSPVSFVIKNYLFPKKTDLRETMLPVRNV